MENQKAPEHGQYIAGKDPIEKEHTDSLAALYVYQKSDYEQSEAAMRYDAEELACVKQWLDDMKAPICDTMGETYSVIGRIRQLMAGITTE